MLGLLWPCWRLWCSSCRLGCRNAQPNVFLPDEVDHFRMAAKNRMLTMFMPGRQVGAMHKHHLRLHQQSPGRSHFSPCCSLPEIHVCLAKSFSFIFGSAKSIQGNTNCQEEYFCRQTAGSPPAGLKNIFYFASDRQHNVPQVKQRILSATSSVD